MRANVEINVDDIIEEMSTNDLISALYRKHLSDRQKSALQMLLENPNTLFDFDTEETRKKVIKNIQDQLAMHLVIEHRNFFDKNSSAKGILERLYNTKTDTAMEELEWQKHAYKTGDQYVTRCGKIAIFMTSNAEKQELTWVMNSEGNKDGVVVFKTDFDCHEINGDTCLDIVGEHYIVPIDEYLNRRVKI